MEPLSALKILFDGLPPTIALTIGALVAGIALALHITKTSMSGATSVSDSATKLVEAQGKQIEQLSKRLDTANARLDQTLDRLEAIEAQNENLMRHVERLERMLSLAGLRAPRLGDDPVFGESGFAAS